MLRCWNVLLHPTVGSRYKTLIVHNGVQLCHYSWIRWFFSKKMVVYVLCDCCNKHICHVIFPQVVFVGFLIGGIFWGAVCDMFGRKKVSSYLISYPLIHAVHGDIAPLYHHYRWDLSTSPEVGRAWWSLKKNVYEAAYNLSHFMNIAIKSPDKLTDSDLGIQVKPFIVLLCWVALLHLLHSVNHGKKEFARYM